MPPALSDVDSSDNELPASKPPAKGAPQLDDQDDNDDDDDDEFVVEKILGHRFNKGVLQFDVKWQGYDNPKDRTWEPEENMETAADVLKEYFEDIGGRPEKPGKGIKRKAGPATAPKSETATPNATTKRARRPADEPAAIPWSPPAGSWEDEVSHVDTVEQSLDSRTGKEGKFAYLVWNNQKKTQHPLKHTYTKCPQKMLQYYENHLVFTNSDAPNTLNSNGDTMDET